MRTCDIVFGLLVLGLLVFLACTMNKKKEGFCASTCGVPVKGNTHIPGVGRSDGHGCGKACRCSSKATVGKQYAQPDYRIDGMDSTESIKKYVAKKAEQREKAIRCPWTNPDNLYGPNDPKAMAMGGTPDGHLRMSGTQVMDYAYSDKVMQPCDKDPAYNATSCGNTEFFSLVDGDEAPKRENFQPKNDTGSMCDPNSMASAGGVCLPDSMCFDKCGDPNTYVYERAISVNQKSKLRDAGANMLMGDLPICPACPTDAYGHEWFRPGCTGPSSTVAGAMRFMMPTNIGVTNIDGDIYATRDCNEPSNLDVQYSVNDSCGTGGFDWNTESYDKCY